MESFPSPEELQNKILIHCFNFVLLTLVTKHMENLNKLVNNFKDNSMLRLILRQKNFVNLVPKVQIIKSATFFQKVSLIIY